MIQLIFNNSLDSRYRGKVYCIIIDLPFVGNRLNKRLQNYYYRKYGACGSYYNSDCNYIEVYPKGYLTEAASERDGE